jgi:hypothetical protein
MAGQQFIFQADPFTFRAPERLLPKDLDGLP